MKKHLLLASFLSCVFGATLFAAPAQNPAAVFKAAVEQVDSCGEMLYYQNTAGVEKLLHKFIPDLLNTALKDQPTAPTINSAYNSLLNLINIKAIQAVASSSKEITPDLYVYKSFILIDKQQKSILIDPTAANAPVDWRSYPADTVVAVKGKINFPHIWQMIKDEIRKSPDPAIQSLDMQIEMLKKTGIDIDAVMQALDGDLELLITFSNENFAIKLTIPDKNGKLTAWSKSFLPPQANSGRSAAMPIPGFSETVIALYQPGKIVLATDEKLFNKPEATLGDLPEFKNFNANLPASGNGVVILNLSGNLLNFIKNSLQTLPEVAQITAKIPPMALIAVSSTASNGEKYTCVSNFSIPQLQLYSSMAVPVITLLPALNSARERGRVTSCISNMKQVATGCLMYANEHGDVLPKSIDELTMKKLIPAEAAANAILLAPGVKLSTVANPGQYPLAICDRFNHKSDKVCVAFIDGHVENIIVPEDADEREVIAILNKTYKFPPAVFEALLKAVSVSESK